MEKHMKKSARRLSGIKPGIAGILGILLFTSTLYAATFKKEYRLQVNVGPTYYWSMGAAKFAELVKEKTNGQINIKPYYGSTLLLGAQLKSTQMVAKGVIDCAYESTINISPVVQETNVFHLPFFINTFENLDRMKAGKTGQAVFAAMQKIGVKPLAWAENGFRQITNSKQPILSPRDLKGMRIRVVGNPLFIDTFRQLGADPVNMNWGDAQTGFQQGMVDGQENPVGILIPVQIWQYHKYATLWNYMVDPLVIYWNLKEWEAFPLDIQKAISEAARASGRFEIALCRSGLDGETSVNVLQNEFNYTMEIPDPVKYIQSKGMDVSFLTDEQIKAFAEATAPVVEKWSEKIGPELVNMAREDMGMAVKPAP
jgi:TRAP-type transport system periplasmic protein